MKIVVVSDIHGGFLEFKKIIEQEDFDKLIVLGDLFSYGFRGSDLSSEPIIHLLQKYKDKLVLIKGNCDAFIDYEKVNLFAHDVVTLTLNQHKVTFTHGNRYKKGFLPSYHGDIIITGHTHIPVLVKEKDMIYANPGSISKPRGFSSKSYLVFLEDKLIIKSIEGNILKEYKIGI